MKIHPAADIFPMQPDDGLQSLAESIKANGLRFPIVIRKVDGEDEVIDGRNRLRACEIAGVEPRFTVFPAGDDEDAILAFIADANLQRRDLKKTQKAALFAHLYPKPARLKRKGVVIGNNNSDVIRNNEAEFISDNFYPHQLSKCRAVIQYSPALLADIINDRVPLETAFNEAKEAASRSKGKEAQFARLRTESADLADLVEDESMTLAEALAANEERMRERAHRLKEAREAAIGLWRDIAVRLGVIAHGSELGEPYALPEDEWETARNVMRLLTEMVDGKK